MPPCTNFILALLKRRLPCEVPFSWGTLACLGTQPRRPSCPEAPKNLSLTSQTLSSLPLLLWDLQQNLSSEPNVSQDRLPFAQTHTLCAFNGAKIPEVRLPEALITRLEMGWREKNTAKETYINTSEMSRATPSARFCLGPRLCTINASLQACLGHSSHLDGAPHSSLSPGQETASPTPPPVAGCSDHKCPGQAGHVRVSPGS